MHEAHKKWLMSLSSARRELFLAELSHGMTIAMRAICHGGDGENIGIIRANSLNEVHHAISKYLLSIISGNENKAWIGHLVDSALSVSDPILKLQIDLVWGYAARAAEEG